MTLNKKRSFTMTDYDIDNLNHEILSSAFDEMYDELYNKLFDELFDEIFDDVFTNIFEYSKYVDARECCDERLMHDRHDKIKCIDCSDYSNPEIKKCYLCKKTLDKNRDYNFKKCRQCINNSKSYRKCTKCKVKLDKTHYFRKCPKCLEKQRLYRIRRYNIKQCSDCSNTIPSQSKNDKCIECIRRCNLIKCNRCYNILETDYKFKVCVECRHKMKQLKDELIDNLLDCNMFPIVFLYHQLFLLKLLISYLILLHQKHMEFLLVNHRQLKYQIGQDMGANYL